MTPDCCLTIKGTIVQRLWGGTPRRVGATELLANEGPHQIYTLPPSE
jgi:hypothetical protein